MGRCRMGIGLRGGRSWVDRDVSAGSLGGELKGGFCSRRLLC